MATGGESTGVTSCTQAVPLTPSNAVTVCDILNDSGFSSADWESLAPRLGVRDTKSIWTVHPRDPFLCLYDVICQWLQSDHQASWAKLADEVRKVQGYGPNTAKTILINSNTEHATAPSIQLSSQLQTADYIIKYAICLKHYYRKMSVLPSSREDWPPSLGSQFTKLTIIERQERFPDSEQAKSLEADCIHGRVNKIAAQEKVIEDVTELFETTESEVTVLLDGAPGIGKTTLCRKACKDWADGTKLQNYQLVVLLPLREKRVREAKVVDDLFRADDPKLQREVVQHIKETSGEHLLLILDGYDELTLEEQTEESLFFNIIEGNQLQKCSVLVTSRPYASDDLQGLHCINYHVEVLGLTEEQVRNCFIQNTSGEEEATKLTKMLQEKSDIISLCYTPLNCAILLYVYKQGHSAFPKTLTELFEIFVLHTLKRHAKNLTLQQRRSFKVSKTLEEIPDPVKRRLHDLCKVAFIGLTSGKLFFSILDLEEEFSECSEADIETNISGLMTAVKGFSIRGEEINFQFLHLSLQEFLAARYAAVNLSAKKQTELIQRHLGGSHLHQRMMLPFLAGISRLKGIKLGKFFSEVLSVISGPYNKRLHADIDCDSRYSQFPYWYHESSYSAPQGQYQLSYWLDKSHYNSAPQKYSASKLSTVPSSNCDESYPKSLYTHQKALNKFILLLHLLYESRDNGLYWNVQAMIKKEELHFSFCQLLPSDCMVLGHFLSATPRPWELLEFYFCGLTGHSIEIFCKAFSGYTNCVDEVRISYSSSSVLTRLSLFPKIPWLKYTKKVTLQGIQYPLGVPAKQVELHSVLDMQNLTDLTLLVERIPEEHIADYGIALSHFMTAVVHSKKLEKLSYAGPFPPNCDLTIFQILQHTLSADTALNELNLAIPGLGEVQISQHHSHFVLLLSQESDTELVCNQIFKQSIVNMDSLTSPCTETFVLICRNCDFITRLSLLPRVPLMKHAKHVRLVMEYSVERSAEQTMPSLAKVFEHKILADNPLWHLDVMLLGLGKVTLQHNNLPYFQIELEDTPVTEKCQQFFKAMDECSFQHQNLSVQRLRDTGTDQFATGLAGNESVKILNISNNNINSAGAVAIFRSLECNTSLEELDMSHNKQLTEGDSTSEAVGCAVERMLTVNTTLKVLKLGGCGLNDVVLKHISTGLSHNKSLDLLDITCNTFSALEMLYIWKTQEYTKTRQIEFDKQPSATTNPQYIGEVLNMCGMKCPFEIFPLSVTDIGEVNLFTEERNELVSYKFELKVSTTTTAEAFVQFFNGLNPPTLPFPELSVRALTNQTAEHFAAGLAVNTSVKTLDNSKNNISCEGAVAIFRSLGHNTSLEELDLSGNRKLTEGDSEAVGRAVERMLTWNETLKVLKLSGCGLNDSVLKHISTGLSHNNSLDLLDIACNNFSAVEMLYIQEYTKTRQIEFDKQPSATTNPQYIGELLNMCGMKCPFKIFPLSVTDIGKVNLFAEEQKELVSYKLELKVSTTTTAEAFVQFFNGLNPPTLPYPELSVGALTYQAKHFAAGLAMNTSVKTLDISKSNISSAGAEAIFRSLEHNTSLEILDLTSNVRLARGGSEEVGCAVERMLRGNKTLKVLKLRVCGLNDVVLKHISTGLSYNNSLDLLDITCNEFSVVGMLYIWKTQGYTETRQIEFDKQPSATTNPQYIGELLNMCGMKCPFEIFPLSVTDIGEVNVFTEERNELVSYKLELKVSTTTTAEAFVQFFNGLNLPALTFPELSVRALTNQTAEHFAAGLAVNTSVKTLDISKNNIGSAGAEAIFRSLERNTSLEILDLTSNVQLARGGSEAVGCAVERMLTMNKTLKVLKLSGCGLNYIVLKHISTGLSHNKSLDLLDITCNNFSVEMLDFWITLEYQTRQIEF